MSMPTVFVSHGAPTLILEDRPARAFLTTLGELFPRPKAIIAVSAHWTTERPAVSTNARPETIHDFYGFPEALYRLHYDAAGAPELAERVAALTGAVADPAYGLDHGAWVPAMLGWPKADIPIFQLSVQPYRSPGDHIALGRKLASLRDEGVLVMGSGSATHNLHRLVRGQPGATPAPESWAKQFDDWLAQTLEKGDEGALADYRRLAPYAEEAHPTDEHFLPLHVAFGAAGPGAHGKALHRSFTLGNLSMAAYAFS
ncbi:Aromatic ring-opening dioxygenase, catalytic subunit, LigB family [Enhydrobacter aerosaccus]|uniref:Aromatic ring-opening dioxygenase, catalytic subunit, LigB family n=1 Tax=Enhydrobacter aerosaccus TaxID=225324 RepID=A0A1T4TFW1_9HYPH|nr:class III extradiol ring-cleavage dioxygenase [Enhydrobacter aerosaccus]SKA39188.1 Aromatic ring-opening dioxygenase, catalytic subunit, LigB family [Enhydrobacter aerosaccus]